MKRLIGIIVLLLIGSGLATSAYSETERIYQTNVTIGRLGSHWDTPLYLDLVEGFDVPCAYNLIYCRKENKECPFYYSTALAAKLTERKLQEIRYDYDPDTGYCNLVLIAIE